MGCNCWFKLVNVGGSWKDRESESPVSERLISYRGPSKLYAKSSRLPDFGLFSPKKQPQKLLRGPKNHQNQKS